MFEGIAIYNLLRNHPADITVYIDGVAASMASVVAMAGDRVVMPENAMMMIHKPWGSLAEMLAICVIMLICWIRWKPC